MNSKNTKKTAKAGLGRSLSELLSDNDELVNMDSKVLMHKDDGTSVKIYNKPDSRPKAKGTSRKNEPDTHVQSAPPPPNWRSNENRIEVGKSREERREESQGIYRHGKPHVVSGGAPEPIKITPNSPKKEDEAPRIFIGDGKSSSSKTTAESLEQLDKYRPTVRDTFLEDLLELSESTPSKSYETDSDGRIIIGSQNRSRVKKR